MRFFCWVSNEDERSRSLNAPPPHNSAPCAVGARSAYEKDGITVYIMSNNQRRTAAWMLEDLIICAIMGDLTEEEIEAIIDSV